MTEDHIPLAVVACGACQNVYLRGGNRHFCPTCGGEPGYIIQEIEEVSTDVGKTVEGTGEESGPSPGGEAEPTGRERKARRGKQAAGGGEQGSPGTPPVAPTGTGESQDEGGE